jgi:hypothetical protein|tara:strand:+ start:103 stop:528 length:426 start_codon:yes stop_codon:yes gene_type:complete
MSNSNYEKIDKEYEQKILNDIKNIESENWWDMLDEFLTDYIDENELSEEEYLGHIFLALIDEECIENEEFDNVRMKKSVLIEDLKTLETWIGKEEVEELKNEFKDLDDNKKNEMIIIYLYSNGWKYITSFQTDKETIESWK